MEGEGQKSSSAGELRHFSDENKPATLRHRTAAIAPMLRQGAGRENVFQKHRDSFPPYLCRVFISICGMRKAQQARRAHYCGEGDLKGGESELRAVLAKGEMEG